MIKREGKGYDRMRKRAEEDPSAPVIITRMALLEIGRDDLASAIGQNRIGAPTWTGDGECPTIFWRAQRLGHLGAAGLPGAGRVWCPKISPFRKPEAYMPACMEKCDCGDL